MQIFPQIDQFTWIVHIFIVVFVTTVVRFLQKRAFKKILARLAIKHNIWDEIIIYALQKPVGLLIWLLGLSFAANVAILQATNPVQLLEWLTSGRRVGIIIVASWFVLRFISRAERNLTAVDKTTASAISRLLRIAIGITTALVMMQTLGIPMSGVLALGGAGTFVVGMASKDLMANFFGALVIHVERPFVIGDWIRSPDREIEGTVEYIGWRSTRIRCFSKRPLYVPNSVFNNISIENPSRMTNRQIKDIIGVRYKDASKLPVILAAIETMLREHPQLDTNQTTFVTFSRFGASSLDCQIYCFTKTTQWVEYLRIQQDVFLKILAIVQEHGGDAAFPTRTLEITDYTNAS
ncbi:MAG: mechanosensitive ion channel protein MscS [Legionellales bacterium]|nr:MAG: mechanosensitive ion channel protein MscS [Legionellales bacterium]